ncbi:chain-length determining protein [Halieaceae bacterium IMCC14734]|uniref:Chain-length determining protein n=1 Tax=Candidatus Litorirhabdus singularis TaxID=2518993 RepID=A0ABT3TE67_9GAMM|nr:chain-length determining protein [Candidatus Litorirhabdus singularis]MCX2980586.1 chain-length determining protein [Candidatus Litorirhabdus singularis]
MNTTETISHKPSAVMELDLMPYLNALIEARWILVIAVLVSAVLAGFAAYSKPYMFQSAIKVSVVDIEDPGGVSPDDRRASEVLTLVEHGFVMGTTHDNYNDVMRARLNSRDFTMRFLDEHNVYRHFYPTQWIEDEQRWRGSFTPDRGEVFTRFRDEVRNVSRDEETDIITIGMNWPDPAVARDWANQYVRSFNEFIRERTINDVRSKQEYLKQELNRSDLLEMQKSIYRLIEAQTAIAMLANAREEYALEIIDPAALPYRSFNMSRKKRIAIGTVTGFLLTVFGVLAWVLLAGMLQKITHYRAQYLELAANDGAPKP